MTKEEADLLFSQAAEAAKLRISARQTEAVAQAQSRLGVDQTCANETYVCYGRPSRADQARIANRYNARLATASAGYSSRVSAAQSASEVAMRQLRTIRSSYESAADRPAIVTFVVSQLQAL